MQGILDSSREESGWGIDTHLTCLNLNQFTVSQVTFSRPQMQLQHLSHICSATGITISLMDCSVTGQLQTTGQGLRVSGQAGGVSRRSPKNKAQFETECDATIATNFGHKLYVLRDYKLAQAWVEHTRTLTHTQMQMSRPHTHTHTHMHSVAMSLASELQ